MNILAVMMWIKPSRFTFQSTPFTYLFRINCIAAQIIGICYKQKTYIIEYASYDWSECETQSYRHPSYTLKEDHVMIICIMLYIVYAIFLVIYIRQFLMKNCISNSIILSQHDIWRFDQSMIHCYSHLQWLYDQGML